jgi:hypothetical protein
LISSFLAHLAFRPCHFIIGIPFNIKISKHKLLPAFFGKQFSNQALQYGRFVYLTQKKITHPALIWFNGFQRRRFNVIFYQNMPNLHNWYTSAERKIKILLKKCLFISVGVIEN